MDKPQHQDLFYWKEGRDGEGETSSLLKHSPGPVQWLLPAVTTQHPKKQQEPSLLGKLVAKPLTQVPASHSPRKPNPGLGVNLLNKKKQLHRHPKKQSGGWGGCADGTPADPPRRAEALRGGGGCGGREGGFKERG